jgi:hypothetical protein
LTGRIAKRLPELIDGRIEAMFEVTGGGSGPKAAAKSLTSQQVAWPLYQRAKNLAGLRGEPHFVSVLAQLPRCRVEFERPKGQLRRS